MSSLLSAVAPTMTIGCLACADRTMSRITSTACNSTCNASGVMPRVPLRRKGTRGITPDALQVLLQAVDVIRDMVRSAQAKQPIVMVGATALSSELIRILAQKSASVTSAAEGAANLPGNADASPAAAPPEAVEIAVNGIPPSGPLEGWRIAFEPDSSLFKTCNDPMRIFDELANLGTLEVAAHTAKVPPFGERDPTQCFLSWTLLLRCTAEHARVAEVFDWVDANSKIVYEPIYGAAGPAAVAS